MTWQLGDRTMTSRLIVGTGKYPSFDLMNDALDASGAELITVALRRITLDAPPGQGLLDHLDLERYSLLPNTAGCFSAADAILTAKLAREAEISYATLAMATDYDCWHEGHDDVTVEQVIATVKANVALAQRIITEAVPHVAAHGGDAPHSSAVAGSIMTAPDAIPADRRAALAPLIAKYLG